MLLGLACWALPVQATAADALTTTRKTGKDKKKKGKKKQEAKSQEKAPEDENDTKQPAELSPIGKLLKDAEYLTPARPNLQAQYYIFLYYSSEFDLDRTEMERLIDEYPHIKKNGKAELILISFNDNTATISKIVKNKKGTFPIIAKGKMPRLHEPIKHMSNCSSSVVFADTDGKVVAGGNGGMALQWRYFTDTPDEIESDSDNADEESAQSDSDEKPDPDAVANALKEVKFISGKPTNNAKYYVFLHSASWCPPCCELTPHIVEKYKKLKRKKVEIILISGDHTEEEAKDYVKKYKINFPATTEYMGIGDVPGYRSTTSYPHAIVVDKTGRVIAEGHGCIILDLENILKKNKRSKDKKHKNRD